MDFYFLYSTYHLCKPRCLSNSSVLISRWILIDPPLVYMCVCVCTRWTFGVWLTEIFTTDTPFKHLSFGSNEIVGRRGKSSGSFGAPHGIKSAWKLSSPVKTWARNNVGSAICFTIFYFLNLSILVLMLQSWL